MSIRPTAVAGTWYPGTAGALTRDVDAYLTAATDGPAGTLQAIIAPHAGLMFSGPVGAHAASLEGEKHDAMRDAVHRNIGSPEGAFELTASAWCAVGTV